MSGLLTDTYVTIYLKKQTNVLLHFHTNQPTLLTLCRKKFISYSVVYSTSF